MFVSLRCPAWPVHVLQIIHHYQYTEWPDYGRPDKVEPLIELLEEMRLGLLAPLLERQCQVVEPLGGLLLALGRLFVLVGGGPVVSGGRA